MVNNSLTEKNITRRGFLRIGVGFSALVGGLTLPVELLAGRPDPIGQQINKLESEITTLPQKPGRKPRAPRLLMLDPGHGGRDPGAIGRRGTQEKDVTLDIARRMADYIAGQTGVDAKLTRDEDEFIPLPERVKIAQTARADFLLSVHADSAPDRLARGLSTYTLSEKASDAFSKALATQENRIEAMGGVDLDATDRDVAAILMDLTARRTRNTSQRVRYDFVQGMGRNWPLLERPMRAANFAVLRAPDIPSLLVETGFLSNSRDENLLRQPQQRQRIARLMAQEIVKILNSSLFS